MATRTTWTPLIGALLVLAFVPPPARGDDSQGASPAADAVSYDKQVRPIFQAQCQGCHQPAKPGGGYVMTSFDRLLAGGESKAAAVVPRNPTMSHLIEQITPEDGEALMPKGKPPISPAELKLVTDWIA